MKQKVIVPSYFKGDKCEELTIADVRKFSIEQRLMTDPKTPKFYLYYATIHGDVLGTAILTDHEIIFDPLNEQFKGLLSYQDGDILNNHRMGFIVGYDDIIGEIGKISIPDNDGEDTTDVTFDLQLGLKHTGN